MLRKSVYPVLCFLVMCGVVLARQQTVKLRNGGEITGEVTKTPDGYKITLPSGGTTVLKADQVVAVVDAFTFEEEYEKQKALVKVDPDNPHKAHYELAKWAHKKGHLEIAQKELQEALKLKPDYEAARLLLKRIEKELQDKDKPKTLPDRISPGDLIGDVDINRIRLVELRGDEEAVIAFAGNVIKKFMDAYKGKGMFAEPDGDKKFLQYSNMEKAMYILDNIDRENYAIKDKILIRSDPKFMVDFRNSVWPVIVSSCGSSKCHGGQKIVGGLRLLRRGARGKVDYTNFYTLDSYKQNELSIIDRNNPENSLLLQYGLLENLAEFRHKTQITPLFADKTDPKYLRLRDWILSLRAPHPGYGVKYKPPTGEPPKKEETAPPAPQPEPAKESQE